MRYCKEDFVPDKILAPISEEVFLKQFYNRNCIVIDGTLYEILEESTASRVLLKYPNKKIKKTYYVTKGGIKPTLDMINEDPIGAIEYKRLRRSDLK